MLALLSLVRLMISGTVAPSALSSFMVFTTSVVRSGLGPNLTPSAFALLMPSCCRSRRMSFSNSAMRAVAHDQLAGAGTGVDRGIVNHFESSPLLLQDN